MARGRAVHGFECPTITGTLRDTLVLCVTQTWALRKGGATVKVGLAAVSPPFVFVPDGK